MKWEYMHALSTKDTKLLNSLGDKGWELIVAFRENEDTLYYIYKRPKLPGQNEEAVEGYFGGKVG